MLCLCHNHNHKTWITKENGMYTTMTSDVARSGCVFSSGTKAIHCPYRDASKGKSIGTFGMFVIHYAMPSNTTILYVSFAYVYNNIWSGRFQYGHHHRNPTKHHIVVVGQCRCEIVWMVTDDSRNGNEPPGIFSFFLSLFPPGMSHGIRYNPRLASIQFNNAGLLIDIIPLVKACTPKPIDMWRRASHYSCHW